MEIKTIEQLLENHKGEVLEYHSKLKVVPYDYAVELAIQFAKQFIDLAYENAEIKEYSYK